MKTKTILIALIVMLAFTALVFQSCKKDDKEDPTPPIYTNGQGEIGEIGGTVKIDDPSSPINGASIVIPEGALSNNTTISIVPAPENIYFPGDSTLQLIAFEPEGLEFTKPVQITIPYKNSDAENIDIFYYNPDSLIIYQIPKISINSTNKLITGETNHFSYYTVYSRRETMDIEMLNINGKIGARLKLNNLAGMPTSITYGAATGYWNVWDALKYSSGQQYSVFVVKLYKEGFFWDSEEAELRLYIDRIFTSQFDYYKGEIYKAWEGDSRYLTEILSDSELETWFSGEPLIFNFSNSDYSQNDNSKYFLKVKWALTKHPEGFYLSRHTPVYEFNNKEHELKLGQMTDFTDIYKEYLDNSFIDNGTNDPPNDPSLQSPSYNATNISINANLSWTCTDPEGDELDYNIYFGTSSNPEKVEEYYTSTTYDPGTLEENTTYYWYIKAYEVGNDDNQSESQHWSFTTADGGSGNTPPTALFTVSPSSGTTSTNFAFDASGSTDNEDPTSNLQVRWDFDGNGSWDTGWDYDKTENHQYSSENTYTAKLEVKDTEGLTDQYTKNITVSNGGGNEPPNQPTNETPNDNATNISVNTNLSWTCTDPEGNALDYNIYFGTSNNPPKVEEYYTSTTYDPGTLDENTTYYWQIKAYEVDNNSNYSESPIWVFTTGEGSGGLPCPGTPTVTDADGNVYNTVQIGNQCWMAENLNYETTNSWWYDNSSANGDIYGRLYTWEAALTACPSGWSLPSDEEWKTMEMALGMSQSDADNDGWRGTNEGEKMKSTSGWDNNGNGTNSSGFAALPGSYRDFSGSFYGLGQGGYWWSNMETTTEFAWSRNLHADNDRVLRFYGNKADAFSVRCIKN